jgi:hypothetical protein
MRWEREENWSGVKRWRPDGWAPAAARPARAGSKRWVTAGFKFFGVVSERDGPARFLLSSADRWDLGGLDPPVSEMGRRLGWVGGFIRWCELELGLGKIRKRQVVALWGLALF